jgi:glycosyltransferase involved in cell wall biosynthesis
MKGLCIIVKKDYSIFNLCNCVIYNQTLNINEIDFLPINIDISKVVQNFIVIIREYFPQFKLNLISNVSTYNYSSLFCLTSEDYNLIQNTPIISKISNIGSVGILKLNTNKEFQYKLDTNTFDKVHNLNFNQIEKYNGDKPIKFKINIVSKGNINALLLPKKNRIYGETNSDNKIFLIQQYFIHSDKNRQKELDYCIKTNSENPFIDEIFLLNEEIYKSKILISNKITQSQIYRRIKFSDVLRFIKYNLDGYVIFSNSDIFFDKSIELIKYSTLNSEKSIETLCRFEYDGKKKLDDCILKSKPRFNCQDTWIVHSKFIKELSNNDITKFNFDLGVPGCDHKLLYEINNLGFIVYNNPNKLRSYHYHSSQIRNYDSKNLLDLPFAYSDPVVDNLTKNQDFLNDTNLFWQYPVITEKEFFNQNYKDKFYLPVPWATILDKFKDKLNFIVSFIKQYYQEDNYYTCCQSIHYRKLIEVFKVCNITKVYTPHKVIGLDTEDNIQYLPCPLYAVNIEDNNRNENIKDIKLVTRRCKYLYSFQGAWMKHYISDIRKKIFNLPKKDGVYIKNTGEWHFEKNVYTSDQNKDEVVVNTVEANNDNLNYNELLMNSYFTLCPSGAGPNSIRFWEALGSASVPILIADTLDLPKHSLWDKSIIRISEKELILLLEQDILKKIPYEQIVIRRKNCLKIYEYFRKNYKNNSTKAIVHYCCGSYKYGDIGGVARYDFDLQNVFPDRIFFHGPSEKTLLIEFLNKNPNSIVFTDNHLACDIPNKYFTYIVHHGCALTHAEREPGWDKYWKELCCNGQLKMLNYRDPKNTHIISISQFCTDEFKKHFGSKYEKFRRIKILHSSQISPSIKLKWNTKPIVLHNCNGCNKGQSTTMHLQKKAPQYIFNKLHCKADKGLIKFWNKKKETIYKNCDIFLQLSLSEGYGYSTLDALFCGLPVVATNVGLFYEDLPEDCFVKLDYKKRDDLDYVIDKINYAWKNRELLTKRAHDWIIKNCDFEEWRRKMLKLI